VLVPGEGSSLAYAAGVTEEQDWIWRGRPKRHVYPVVRVDPDNLAVDRTDIFPNGLVGIDIPIVLATQEEAEAEAARLNALNSDKGLRYYPWLSRFYPEGRRGT
jgi:hypothetical protein